MTQDMCVWAVVSAVIPIARAQVACSSESTSLAAEHSLPGILNLSRVSTLRLFLIHDCQKQSCACCTMAVPLRARLDGFAPTLARLAIRLLPSGHLCEYAYLHKNTVVITDAT